jgi:hypothetical protein
MIKRNKERGDLGGVCVGALYHRFKTVCMYRLHEDPASYSLANE